MFLNTNNIDIPFSALFICHAIYFIKAYSPTYASSVRLGGGVKKVQHRDLALKIAYNTKPLRTPLASRQNMLVNRNVVTGFPVKI